MPITHNEAQHLIQLDMENMLDTQQLATLTAHLRGCQECDAYANEIREVSGLLSRVMKRQWSLQPAPLSIAALVRRRERIDTRTFLTMRTAALGLMFFAFFFSAWQFVVSGAPGSSQLPLAVGPVPTPSLQKTQSASPESTRDSCEMILYRLQGTDTLASIAKQFSTSEDEIIQLNHLGAAVVSPAMELIVPLCTFTPTGTFHPVTFTTTYTPLLSDTTITPDG